MRSTSRRGGASSMLTLRPRLISLVVATLATVVSQLAHADEPKPDEGSTDTEYYEPAEEELVDKSRVGGGASIVGGPFSGPRFKGGVVGVEGRFGVQLGDLIGLYARTHVGLGPIANRGAGSMDGVFAATAGVDLTLFDHLYFGGGAGFADVAGLTSLALDTRVGGYPWMNRSDNGYRRTGVRLGVDLRCYPLRIGSAHQPVGEITTGIGFDAF